MSDHYTEYCVVCGTIISQCRCMDCNRTKRYSVCTVCEGKKKQEEAKQSDSLNKLADAIYALAIEKGWHDPAETRDHFVERACNNLHDEVSELHEAWRNNRLDLPCDKADKMEAMGLKPLTCLEEELADIVIRAFDNARRLDIDILTAIQQKHEYNKSRSFRHGNKRS